MKKNKKLTKTYSIDNIIYDEFSSIIKLKMFNKSQIVESLIKKWIEENK